MEVAIEMQTETYEHRAMCRGGNLLAYEGTLSLVLLSSHCLFVKFYSIWSILGKKNNPSGQININGMLEWFSFHLHNLWDLCRQNLVKDILTIAPSVTTKLEAVILQAFCESVVISEPNPRLRILPPEPQNTL